MPIHLPTLSEKKSIRLFTVTAMYAAQGIQLGLMMVSLPAFLAAQGVDGKNIGAFIGAVLIPWTLKIFLAPLMDRFSFFPMGRRRPWVMLGIFGASLGYIVMALVPDPIHHFWEFTIAAVVVSTLTALLDVAVDGMAIDILPEEEQSLANGYMWGGKVVGSAATSAGAAFTLSMYGISVTFVVAAIFCSFFFLIMALFRERPHERFFPWTQGNTAPENLEKRLEAWSEILGNLFRVIFLPSSIWLILASYLHGLSYGLFDALMPVFTVQQLEWQDTAFSSLAATAGLVGGILGMTLGGRFIQYFGRIKSMKLFLLLIFLSSLAMGLWRPLWEYNWITQGFVMAVYLYRTLFLIGLFATAMAFCWKPISASQFALYMAIGNLGISNGATILGLFPGQLPHSLLFFLLGCFAILAAFFLFFINIEKHLEKVENLKPVRDTPIELRS